MKILLKNARIVNVFTDSLLKQNVLIENDKIIGIGDYQDKDADVVEDMSGKIICPGFIDGHIHIESSMLEPFEFARVCLAHGTTSVIADPHEIANVSGLNGIAYMLQASEGIPMNIYFVIPSCVPATQFDEAGATLLADDFYPLFSNKRVLGLGEMMNFPGVINDDPEVLKKIQTTLNAGLIVNGHAPLLSGRDLDHYIAAGIFDDHECSSAEEAIERIEKGQWVMVREGTAARNLNSLLELFDEPYSRRCMLVTDDKHPADLIENGHIDSIIRKAVKAGKSVFTAIRMASFQAAQYFGLKDRGAVAPGYIADLIVLDDLESVSVSNVYRSGQKVVDNGEVKPFKTPDISKDIWETVNNSFCLDELKAEDFDIEPKGKMCRVIKMISGELLTDEEIVEIDFNKNQGVDVERDIVKLAVVERHKNTGHIGLGFVRGMGLKKGALASSVAHDSHNLILAGTNSHDMAVAANRLRELGGGLVVVDNGKILNEMPLPVAGLISKENAKKVAAQNEEVREMAHALGIPDEFEPFMSMAFVSLPVIPAVKMTSKGIVNVMKQELVSLFVD